MFASRKAASLDHTLAKWGAWSKIIALDSVGWIIRRLPFNEYYFTRVCIATSRGQP